MTGARALAAWTGPALAAAVVAGITAGTAVAPVLLLSAALAPLVALLQPARAPAAPHAVTLALTAVVAALLLWAHVALLADTATLLGAGRAQAVVLALALALLVGLVPGAGRWCAVVGGLGGVALLLVLVDAAATVGVAPWTAWREAAARPAVVFGARSPWVRDGERLVRGATLAFDEGHRVVAVTRGTLRVVEADGARRVVRDWRLAAGDAVSLRPADTLVAEAGSRLRFEPGKRVPGAAASGSAWADAATRAPLAQVVGLAVTLLLGAVALVPAGGRRAAAAPAIVLVFALGTAAWGVYAAVVAPESGLAGSPAEALLAPARSATPGGELSPGALTIVVVVGLLALFVAAAGALRDRVAETGGRRWPEAWMTAVIAAGLAGLVDVVDPWTPLAAGLGVAAAALAAPRLAGADGAWIGPWPAAAVGGLVGVAVFAAVAALGAGLPAPLAVLRDLPALAAAPAAWVIVKVLRREAGETR
ncbi:MAG TPA: hypothetical protein VGT02_00805 [Methylomirabilota bacterium]|jgi:hypothetical protein|nr:hypothetical protein [Methylomirabilota bacterium]